MAEYLSAREESDLKYIIVLLLKAFPDPSIGKRAPKPLLDSNAMQLLEGNFPPLTSQRFAKVINVNSHPPL
eukprot:6212514-Pleurochrysis_carterae.AAC.4